jgi:hypothetical protein
MTPVCFVLPLLALCANSPEETFAFALFDGDDSNQTIREALSEETLEMLRSLDDFEMEIDGQKIRFQRTEGGDLKYLDSSFGLGGCTATHPCVVCTTPRSKFGDFDAAPNLRTLKDLIAFSHTKVGVYCDVCCKNVTQAMVDHAAKLADSDDPKDIAERKAHMNSHKSVVPGVGPLFHIEPRYFDALKWIFVTLNAMNSHDFFTV